MPIPTGKPLRTRMTWAEFYLALHVKNATRARAALVLARVAKSGYHGPRYHSVRARAAAREARRHFANYLESSRTKESVRS